jgi:Domain of unknown function (DUF4262)
MSKSKDTMQQPPYVTPRLAMWRTRELKPSFVSTLDTIEKSGWQAMLVSSETQSRSFAYTIGIFDVFGFPELITVGLPLEVAHTALDYALDLMKEGVDLTVGTHRDLLGGDAEVIFRPVARAWYERTMYRADWYYEEAVIPALQLIYPDLENRFQWEAGFNDYFRQPMFAPGEPEGPSEHSFLEEDEAEKNWKFPDGRHTNAYLSQTVFDKTETITHVSHDADGDWQFLGGKMDEGGGPVLSCLHHPIDDDPSLEELHDLPLNCYATREKPGSPWQRFEHPPEADANDELEETLPRN